MKPLGTFEMDSAFQGRDGFRMARVAREEGRPYALAFVDVRMPPGWDGITTIEHLWSEDPTLQVVICTAYSDYGWDETLQRLGSPQNLLILKKPFDSAEALQLAYALSEKWRLELLIQKKIDELDRAVASQAEKLSEQRRELQTAHSQLLQSQKLEAIGQLAAGIAHEINTPVQFVADNLLFLQDAFGGLTNLITAHQRLLGASRAGPAPAEALADVDSVVAGMDLEFLMSEAPQAIEQAGDGVQRISKIVRSLKNFSHPGGEALRLSDLNEAIESTITVAGSEWKYVAEVVARYDPNLPLVSCVLGEFNQVILNMVVNAAHAIKDVVGDSGEKGTITVTTRADGQWVEITIQDTGAGIPPDVRAKIFDPFFTTKEVGRGTGQGLAIAHSVVVSSHHGKIDVESEVGHGTVFTIRLPIEQDSALAG
ncbi:MAG: hybrid sensor histidine kinase/response regulator [Actinobacteria bacterium]|nr:hybrid sensor histidine kinase/response regulator [Actinomycetota bacterium]MBI3686269.1 hybrid sensor histidine kinase/response regulator [Actinomycetota bacterium]